VLGAEAGQGRPEGVGRSDAAAGAEDRLDHDAGDESGVDEVKQQLVADVVDRGVAAPPGPRRGERGPVGVRERHVDEAGPQRPVSGADLVDLGAEGGGRGRLAVIAAVEGEDERAAGDAPHHPHRGLDRLGAVQGDVDAVDRAGGEIDEAPGELEHPRRRQGVAVLVAEPADRVDGGADQVLAAGAERDRCRGRGEVEEDVPVDVGDRVPALAVEHERGELVPEALVEERLPAGEQFPGARARKLCPDVRRLRGIGCRHFVIIALFWHTGSRSREIR
jgi:hypothetical protein